MRNEHLAALSSISRTTVRVRYAETDQMGIAYSSMYLVWFEVGRVELLRERGLSYRNIEESGYFLPVTGAGVKYLKPARYDDVLTVESKITNCSRLRVRIEYRIMLDNTTIATGYTEHVFTDRTLKPSRVSKEVADKIIGLTLNDSVDPADS